MTIWPAATSKLRALSLDVLKTPCAGCDLSVDRPAGNRAWHTRMDSAPHALPAGVRSGRQDPVDPACMAYVPGARRTWRGRRGRRRHLTLRVQADGRSVTRWMSDPESTAALVRDPRWECRRSFRACGVSSPASRAACTVASGSSSWTWAMVEILNFCAACEVRTYSVASGNGRVTELRLASRTGAA